MARATCTKCGKEQYWYAGRGRKLSDIKSNCCGAELVGKTKNRANKNKGRKYFVCGICGKRRLPENLCKPKIDFLVFGRFRQDKDIQYKAGTLACIRHDFVPIGKVYGDMYAGSMTEEEREKFFDKTKRVRFEPDEENSQELKKEGGSF